MYNILTLNAISQVGLDHFPSDQYTISDNYGDPDAIVLRSFKMHDMDFSSTLKAVGRAGAGVNNIPIDKLSALGVPVFNAPGANANAVKELVVSGLLLSCRNLCDAWDYTRQLGGDDQAMSKAVEAGKKQFAGFELPGRTIGVVGLGSIGRSVANICIELGMNVIGFDPMLTLEGAWQLSSRVKWAKKIDELYKHSDFITFHVPYNDKTHHMLNADNINKLKPGVTVMNFARDSIVDDASVCSAIKAGQVNRYVTDFPNTTTSGCKGVIGLPHLGASTAEAEDNCAVMVANQIHEYLQDGNVVNSVNFPEVIMPRGTKYRLCVVNANVPNMVGQISSVMAEADLNIHDMINQSKGDLAYTIVDSDSEISTSVLDKIRHIEGVKVARSL